MDKNFDPGSDRRGHRSSGGYYSGGRLRHHGRAEGRESGSDFRGASGRELRRVRFSGCSGYAAALSKGEAQPGLCSPGGEACAKACAELLGTGDVAVEKKTALVHCMGNYDCTSDKMRYDGIDSCAASTLLAGGISSCRYGCMGMGDCAAVCEYGAINVCNGMASIDPAKCRGCAKCTAACPKGLISFVPLKKQAVVRCSNCDKGAETMKVCKVGCIGCGKCMKACEVGAVKVTNFCAKVDPAKCIGCGKCAEVCPRHVITMLDA